MDKLYIYGAGGHGKVAFHSALQIQKFQLIAFLDDTAEGTLCGIPIVKPQSVFELEDTISVHFAIGNNKVRDRLQKSFDNLKIHAATIIHPLAHLYPGTTVGSGTLITVGTIVGPDVTLGQGCILNHHSVIDHDCQIGEFCHIAPSATLGGGVKIGSHCFIGAGATILPYLTLGDNVTVGAGAVVTRSLPDNITVIGCPAKPF